jgi:hypothetical protein
MKIGQSLEDLLSVDGHVPRAVRVTVTGKTPAHGAFFGRAQHLRAEVLNQIGVIGNDKLWLERVHLATAPMDTFLGESDQQEALADLKQILNAAATDPDFLALLQRDLQPFVGKVRSEVREDVPLLSLVRSSELADLVEHVAPALLARLAKGE